METQTHLIRPFDAATDIEPLSALWLEASLIAHPFIGAPKLQTQRRLIEEVYLPKAETWVACAQDAPIGFISLLDHFIGGLFVAPAWQGQGVGRALIADALARKGRLRLEVYLANDQAMRFYRALGFTEVSRRAQDDSGDPFPNATLQLTR
ncbi:GNAT family N-acetyltransferase [Xinfangfangia pollutisoli]|uniref:GNAT family N-acetyltransferase n=1 Tax=Xinfangfangia pollutisoli TaxID=2865960 RepID=UPI001CD1A539|nr:GNAT family N-acetyltransferase [Xinfangfangia pollutisoli]